MIKNLQLRSGIIICTAFILFILIGCADSGDNNPRNREKFNEGWSFINEDIENAQLTEFDNSDWRNLDLPHDWGIEGPFSKEVYFQGGFLPYPGVGWYRKTFEIDARNKNVMIEFDGVMKDAHVWLNGEYIGEWAFGYTSFAFDITKNLKPGKNVLAVRVENVDYSSRWYPGAGIYRNVWLTTTNPVHIGHWGTYVTTPAVSDKIATVKMETTLENNSDLNANVILETTILDADGKNVAFTSSHKSIEKNGSSVFIQELEINNPNRWDLETPYMYTALSIVKQDDNIVDNYETPFGVREFSFDNNKGFSLNGRSLKLNGVNMHHDLGPLGGAVNYRATERQLEILKDMGVNAIRTAHNPPSPEQLELCDKMGILVMDESFDEWRKPKHNVQNSYSALFDEWAERDMAALVLRDRNHPSVIMWSTGNEVPELGTEDGIKSAKMLAEICRELDPTRPVSSGIHLSVELSGELMDIFDVGGFNYWHKQLEDIHKTYPDKPLLVTEASAVLSTRGVYQFPVERIYRGFRDETMQISSYDLINTGFGALPDLEFKLQDDFEWLAGQFVWAGFDYHGEPDPYENAWPAHSSYFGIIDMCGFPKDRFFLYQSQWSKEPMVHILPHWNWAGREGEVTPVYVYTNCSSAELFVNGESKGVKRCEKGVYRLKWEDIKYEAGSIKTVGYDKDGNILAEKEIKTSGKPDKIQLTADRASITADGQDLSFVTVNVNDNSGIYCPTADNLITFELEGEGEILAVGNGNPISHESYQADERKLFNGLCLVIVRASDKSGTIKLTAKSAGLVESSLVIKSIAAK